jgi:transposase
MRDNEFTKILGWPGYRVYRHEIDETAKTLRLWVRRKRGNRKLICSGCGRKFSDVHDCNEREVRDLPWGEYRTTVFIEECEARTGTKTTDTTSACSFESPEERDGNDTPAENTSKRAFWDSTEWDRNHSDGSVRLPPG